MTSGVPQYPFYGPLAKGLGRAAEVITRGGAPAVGKMTFVNNFAAGDTFTINGIVFTANASAGAPAVGKIVFTGNLIAGDIVTINGVAFECKASGATGELEFDVDSTLSLSLDSLLTALNGCTDPLVSLATYTKTDTNTSVTMTFDANGVAGNFVAISSSHDSVVVTQPNGGVNDVTTTEFVVGVSLSASIDALVTKLNASVISAISPATYSKTDANSALTVTYDANGSANNSVQLRSTHVTTTYVQPNGGYDDVRVSLENENTRFDLEDADTIDAYLDDGVETQRKTIANVGLGTINLTSPNDKLPGSTNQYALNSDDVLILQWLAGKWRLLLNDGATAT